MARGPKKARAAKPDAKPHPRAFKWTPEIEAEILTRIMRGESVGEICGPDRDDFTPGEVTFYKRLLDDEAFAKEYARAREAQAHRETDEIRAIADAATPEDVSVAKLRIDARKWRASKLAPKVYGDKQAVEVGGPEGGALQVVIQRYADDQPS